MEQQLEQEKKKVEEQKKKSKKQYQSLLNRSMDAGGINPELRKILNNKINELEVFNK